MKHLSLGDRNWMLAPPLTQEVEMTTHRRVVKAVPAKMNRNTGMYPRDDSVKDSLLQALIANLQIAKVKLPFLLQNTHKSHPSFAFRGCKSLQISREPLIFVFKPLIPLLLNHSGFTVKPT